MQFYNLTSSTLYIQLVSVCYYIAHSSDFTVVKTVVVCYSGLINLKINTVVAMLTRTVQYRQPVLIRIMYRVPSIVLSVQAMYSAIDWMEINTV